MVMALVGYLVGDSGKGAAARLARRPGRASGRLHRRGATLAKALERQTGVDVQEAPAPRRRAARPRGGTAGAIVVPAELTASLLAGPAGAGSPVVVGD
jgi:hypothetical protein